MLGLGCGTRDLGCVVQDLLLWLKEAVVVVHGLSCSEACGVLALQQGSNSHALNCKADSSPLDHWGSPVLQHLLLVLLSPTEKSLGSGCRSLRPSHFVTVLLQACAAPASPASSIPPSVSSFGCLWKPLRRLVITTSSDVSRQSVMRALLTLLGLLARARSRGVSGLRTLHRGEQIPHRSRLTGPHSTPLPEQHPGTRKGPSPVTEQEGKNSGEVLVHFHSLDLLFRCLHHREQGSELYKAGRESPFPRLAVSPLPPSKGSGLPIPSHASDSHPRSCLWAQLLF